MTEMKLLFQKISTLKLLKLLASALLVSSCATLKPYERQYVSDPEMLMTQDSGMGFHNYIYSIREGAAPAGGSKSSGGCGCN